VSAYTVQPGDTFESISRSQFGAEAQASTIQSGNPGISDPPTAGATLFIPDAEVPQAPADAQPGEVSVLINGEKFVGWTDVSFTRAMDAFGVFVLESAWEPENIAFRNAFRPFEYQPVAIFEGNDLLFNGTMLPPLPTQVPNRRVVSAAGYSLPGVISDCTPPISALPLERDAQDLNQVATALLAPFGLTVEVDGDVGPAFQREAIKPEEKIFGYLVKLAQQRKLIMTDTPEGACKFQTEAETGSAVAVLDEGQAGITSVKPLFDTQNYFSHVSGQSPSVFSSIAALAGGTFTVANPRLTGVLRPFTFKAPDTLGGDLKTAVEAKAGRMVANAVQYTVDIPSWRDPKGNLWQPNTTIKLIAPGAMIFTSYEFLVRQVKYRRNHKSESVTLTLTLPGVFNGEIPEIMPWEE
jgi:prophage tail gpP-like protein